jgi:hypothetical protein
MADLDMCKHDRVPAHCEHCENDNLRVENEVLQEKLRGKVGDLYLFHPNDVMAMAGTIDRLKAELTHTRQALESAVKEAGELRELLIETKKYIGYDAEVFDEKETQECRVLFEKIGREEALRPSSAREGKETDNV